MRKRARSGSEDGGSGSGTSRFGRTIKKSTRVFDSQGEDAPEQANPGASSASSASTGLVQGFFPRRRSEPYPAHLAVNFANLSRESLQSYIDHFHLRTRTDAQHGELSVGVAQHFDQFFELDQNDTEDRIINAFVTRYKKEKRAGGRNRTASARVREAQAQRDSDAVVVGDKVAARVGSDWILVKVTKCFPQKDKYQVEDEDSGDDDDKGGSKRGKKHMLGPHQICALPTRDEDHASYSAGFRIMAVYPGTTSFYPGTVMSSPRNQATARILIKFDDDEDPETGTTPEHRIPREHVLPLQR